MKTRALMATLGALWLLLAGPARAMDIAFDDEAAKAVLQALQNPRLTRAEALQIAALPGNRGLVQKAVSYHVAATPEAFADALVAAAHGQPADSETARAMAFDRIKPNIGVLTALLARIETHPAQFRAWVEQRVARFSPEGAAIRIEGYLIVGGQSGGFSFDEPKFWLNLNYFSEFDPAKVVMAHELYHAVQAAYAVDKDDTWLKPESPTAQGRAHQHMCADLANLFASLYAEGSAEYVGDPLLLEPDSGPIAKKTRTELEDGLNQLGAHRTLLELSVLGLQARNPVPFDAVYSLGFYVPEPLYKLGYVMAKAIATDEGDKALAAFLNQPGYRFAQHYMQLPDYGKDRAHVKLGPNTADAINLLASGCKGAG
jgi:hypothetical protein